MLQRRWYLVLVRRRIVSERVRPVAVHGAIITDSVCREYETAVLRSGTPVVAENGCAAEVEGFNVGFIEIASCGRGNKTDTPTVESRGHDGFVAALGGEAVLARVVNGPVVPVDVSVASGRGGAVGVFFELRSYDC